MSIITGRDLPQQYHLGRLRQLPKKLAIDQDRDDDDIPHRNIKPLGALWSAPTERIDANGAVGTHWSDYRQWNGGDVRQQRQVPAIRRMLNPERQLRIDVAADARIVRLASLDDLLDTQQRWPAEAGRIDFTAMAADGLDAVWALPRIIPTTWTISADDQQPYASLRAQFSGWDVESVAWLRTDHLTAGPAVRISPAPEHPVLARSGARTADVMDDTRMRDAVLQEGSPMSSEPATVPFSISEDEPLPADIQRFLSGFREPEYPDAFIPGDTWVRIEGDHVSYSIVGWEPRDVDRPEFERVFTEHWSEHTRRVAAAHEMVDRAYAIARQAGLIDGDHLEAWAHLEDDQVDLRSNPDPAEYLDTPDRPVTITVWHEYTDRVGVSIDGDGSDGPQVLPDAEAAQAISTARTQRAAGWDQETAEPGVTVYMTPGCMGCRMTEKKLSEAGIDFERVDLSERPELVQRFRDEGLVQAPIIESPDGERTAGFDPARIRSIMAAATPPDGDAASSPSSPVARRQGPPQQAEERRGLSL